tara:strand:- start:257 stop:742 length:486 start_codon:yes stop_codon:yes gene_type:complete
MAYKQNRNPFRMRAEDITSYMEGDITGNDPIKLQQLQRETYHDRVQQNLRNKSMAMESGTGFFVRTDPRTGKTRRLTNDKLQIQADMPAVDVTPKMEADRDAKLKSTSKYQARDTAKIIEDRQGSKLTNRQKRLIKKGKGWKALDISRRKAERAKRRAARR